MYKKGKAYVKMDRKVPEFEVRNGIKEEDPLSPNSFNCVLEEIFKKMD